MGHLSITTLGKIGVWLYYDPFTIYGWYRNFNTIFNQPKYDDLDISWALGKIPSNDLGYTPKDLKDDCEELERQLYMKNLSAGFTIHAVLAAYQALAGESAANGIAPYIRSIKYDISRITQALALIDKMYSGWGQDDLWKILPYRVKYGIEQHLINLVKIPGVGGVRAKMLWSAEIKDVYDIVEKSNKAKIYKLLKPQTAAKVIAAAQNLLDDRE